MSENWREGVWLRRRARMYGRIALLLGAVLLGVFATQRAVNYFSSDSDAPSAGAQLTAEQRRERRAAAELRAAERITLTAVGDIVMGTQERGLPPDDGAALFDGVQNQLDGAIIFGNLESPLTDLETSVCEEQRDDSDAPCFAFRTPPEYAGHLALAGFTLVNLANNHALDYGPEGLQQTIDTLRANGVSHTGPKGKYTRVPVRDLVVAFVGFAPYDFANSVRDIDAAKAAVKQANRGSDIVVVSMNAGAEGPDATHVLPGEEEYQGEKRGDSLAFAHAVIDAGADLVVGHGPHVLRGMEVYKNRLIAYSMGNYVGYKALNTEGPLGVSGTFNITLDGNGRFIAGRLHPVQLDADGVPFPGGDALSRVRGLSVEDFGPNAVRVASNGQITPP